MLVKILEWSAIVSLSVGLGGLIAAFLFEWGSTALIIFAAVALSGLMDLGVVLVLRKGWGRIKMNCMRPPKMVEKSRIELDAIRQAEKKEKKARHNNNPKNYR